jgi:hypothetical protein
MVSVTDSWINMQHQLNDTDRVKPKYTKKNNLSQCQESDQSPETWHSPLYVLTQGTLIFDFHNPITLPNQSIHTSYSLTPHLFAGINTISTTKLSAQ